jgi:hypothetical protein
MFASAVRHAKSWLSRNRNPLLRDPMYAGLVALEADMRRRHLPVAAVTAAKRERLHEMLAGGR